MTASEETELEATALEATAFAERAVRAFASAGYQAAAPNNVTNTDGATLFVSGGIQPWREWTRQTGAARRVGLQWCLRMNRLEDAGRSGFVTSFCMLTAARRGPASRYDVLAELFGAFDRIGLDVDRLAFVVPVDGIHPGDPAAAEALNRLGVADDRLAYAPRRWAAPFGQEGPTGPNLFVLTDRTAVPCGDSCGPSCGCGRYLHFWNCEFLGGSPASAGTTAMQSIVDSAGGLERLWSAATGQDMHAGPLLRSITATTSRYVPADAARTVADHARSVALLLAAGIRPAGRGRGHVLRRLTRRAGALLVQNDADPAVLRSAVAAAQACAGGVGGFGTVSAEAFAWLDDEIVCCRESVARSSQLFRHWTRDIPVGADITHLAFRLRAERGMPLLLVRQWSTRDGFRVDEPVLASLFAAEKVSSRSSALAARVAARWEAKPPGLRTLPSPRSAEPSVPQRR